MIAKAKDSHPESGDSKSACAGWARAGLVVRPIPRWCLPSRFRVRAGPRSNHPHPVRFSIGRVCQQPRSLSGELRGVPAEVGMEETAGGLRPGRSLPPSIKQGKTFAESAGQGIRVPPPQSGFMSICIRMGPLASGNLAKVRGIWTFQLHFASAFIRLAPCAASRGVGAFRGYPRGRQRSLVLPKWVWHRCTK